MQKGNLTVTSKNNTDKRNWFSALNPFLYTPDKLFNNFFKKLFGFSGKVETYFYYHNFPDVIDFLLFSAIKVRNMPKEKAKINELDLNSMKKVSYSMDFVPRVTKIHSGLDFEYKVKWVLLNFKRFLQTKAIYPEMKRTPKVKGFHNFSFKGRLLSKLIPPEMFKIKNSILTKEALVNMSPYVKTLNKNELYSIPIEKEPMNKNSISLILLEKFKQKLSASAKVKPSEVKVVSAYENVQIELYKDLRHNPQKNTLMCYLNEQKNHIKTPKNFYLVFGQRLIDKKVFTIVCEN